MFNGSCLPGCWAFHGSAQDSPVRGLWLCTVWASAASVDPAVTAMEGVNSVSREQRVSVSFRYFARSSCAKIGLLTH